MNIKLIHRLTTAIIISLSTSTVVTGQTTPVKNAQALLNRTPHAMLIKREINPGIATFTRQNGCYLKTASYTNYLDDGTILTTPYYLAGSGQTVAEWRQEYKQPWKSQLTDYEGGETKVMLLQVGRHPSVPIKVEVSDKMVFDAQTICAVGAYRIFGRNIKLIRPISEYQDNLNMPLTQGWETNFTY